jgi:hypothetical protein
LTDLTVTDKIPIATPKNVDKALICTPKNREVVREEARGINSMPSRPYLKAICFFPHWLDMLSAHLQDCNACFNDATSLDLDASAHDTRSGSEEVAVLCWQSYESDPHGAPSKRI